MADPYKQCPFRLLKLDPSKATKEEVNKQWRKLMLQSHPDKSSLSEEAATERAKLLNDAKERAVQQCDVREKYGTSSSWASDLFGDALRRHREAEDKKQEEELKKREAEVKKRELERKRREEEEKRRHEEEERKKREAEELQKRQETERRRRANASSYQILEDYFAKHRGATYDGNVDLISDISDMERRYCRDAHAAKVAMLHEMSKVIDQQRGALKETEAQKRAATQENEENKTKYNEAKHKLKAVSATMEEMKRKLADTERQLADARQASDAATNENSEPMEAFKAESQPQTKKQRTLSASLENARKISEFFSKK